MAVVGNLVARILLDNSQFVQQLSRTAGLTAMLGGDMERGLKLVGRSWDKATRSVRNFGLMVAGATAAVSGIGILALKHAAEYEQSQVAFTTMLGSAREAEEFLSNLRRFAAQTPFEFRGLQQSARQLLAFGFSADQVLQMLTPIGDAVAALGGGTEVMDRIIRAIGQIRTKGRVQAEEMLQLTEAGINAWQYLARELGTSTAEAIEMVRRGQVDAATAIRALLLGMQRDFGGGMAAQAKTIMGTWANLKDNLDILLTSLGQAISEAFRVPETLQRLVRWLDRAAQAVENFRTTLKASGIREALDQLASPQLQMGIVALAGAIGGPLVMALWAAAAAAWRAVVPLLPWMALGAAITTAAYLIWRAWGSVAPALGAAFRRMGDDTMRWAITVTTAVAAILGVLGLLYPRLLIVAGAAFLVSRQLAAWYREAQTVAAGMGDLRAIEESAGSTAEQAAKAQQGLGDALADVAKQAERNIQSFDEVHQIQEATAGSALDLARNLDLGLPKLDMPSIPEFKPPEFKLPDFGGFDGIGDAAGGALGALVNAWAVTMQRLTETTTNMTTRLREQFGLLRDDIDLLLGQTIETIDGWSTTLQQRIGGVWQGIPEQWRNIWQEMAEGLTQMWQTLPGAAAQWFGQIRTTLSGLWQGIRADASTAWTSLQQWLGQTWANVRATAGQTFGGLWTDISARWAGVQQSTSQWWTGIEQWLGQKWTTIRLSAGPVFAGLWSDISGIWSSTRQDTTQQWDGIHGGLQGTWQGIGLDADREFGLTRWIIGSHWNLAMIDTSATWNAIDVDLGRWWSGIQQRASMTWQAMVQDLASRWDAIRSDTATKWADIASSLRSTWQGILDAAAAKWNAVKDTIRGAINGIIEMVNRFIRAFNRIEIRVPRIEVPLVGTVGGWSIRVPQIPEIPMLARGGDVIGSGLAVVGEAGPELVSLPRGARVTPLADGGDLEDTVYRAVYQAVYDALSERAGETDRAQEVVLRVDGRTLARLMLPHIIAEGQRQGLPLVVRPQGV